MRPLLPALRRIYGLTLADLLDMPAVDRGHMLEDLATCLTAQTTDQEVTDGSTR